MEWWRDWSSPKRGQTSRASIPITPSIHFPNPLLTPPITKQLFGSNDFHNRRWDKLFPRGIAGLDLVQHVGGIDRKIAGVEIADAFDAAVFNEVCVKVA